MGLYVKARGDYDNLTKSEQIGDRQDICIGISESYQVLALGCCTEEVPRKGGQSPSSSGDKLGLRLNSPCWGRFPFHTGVSLALRGHGGR